MKKLKSLKITALSALLAVLISLLPVSSLCALAETEIITEGFGVDGGFSSRYSHITYTADYDTPLGGRSDTSSVFTVGEAAPGTTVKHTTGVRYTVGATKTYTFEMSVYYDGDAYPAINAMWDDTLGASLLVNVDSDGYCWYNKLGTTTKSEVKLEAGKWNKIAISYEQPRVRFSIWVNGQLLTDSTYGYGANQADKLWFGVDSASSKGRVAYDDFKGYYGAYDPATVIIPSLSVNSEFLKLENGIITYEPSVFATKADLDEALELTDTESTVLYTNDSYETTLADAIGDGYVYVLTSPSGFMSYYTLKRPELKVDSVEFADGEDNSLTAKAVLTYEGIIPTDAVMVLLIRDENGRAERLLTSEKQTLSNIGVTFEVTAPESKSKTAEVFFINDWAHRVSFTDTAYSNK